MCCRHACHALSLQVSTPTLGVTFAPDTVARTLKAAPGEGALIQSLDPKGPAAQAGALCSACKPCLMLQLCTFTPSKVHGQDCFLPSSGRAKSLPGTAPELSMSKTSLQRIHGVLTLLRQQPAGAAGLLGTRRGFGGIMAGDMVTGVNGTKVRYPQDVAAALDNLGVGQKIKVAYKRGIEGVCPWSCFSCVGSLVCVQARATHIARLVTKQTCLCNTPNIRKVHQMLRALPHVHIPAETPWRSFVLHRQFAGICKHSSCASSLLRYLQVPSEQNVQVTLGSAEP